MSVQVLMVLAAFWPAADPTKPTAWEYRVLTAEGLYELGKEKDKDGELTTDEWNKAVEAGLNMLGAEGWELASVPGDSPAGRGFGRGRQVHYYFKRLSVKPAPPPDKTPPEDKGQAEIKIFRLENATAVEVARILQELFGKGTAIKVVADERTNSVLVQARVESLTAITALIEVLDEPGAKAVAEFQVIKLGHADAAAVARVLQELLGKGGQPRIVPDAQTNSLLVSGTAFELHKVRELLKALDKPSEKPQPDR